MNKTVLVLGCIVPLVLAACSSGGGDGGDSNEGGSGGKGGTIGGGAGTTGTGTGTGTGQGGGGAGTPGACDEGDCNACSSCAQAGPCATLVAACQNNADCAAFNECAGACSDDACFQQCEQQYPNGVQPLLDLLSCVICTACPVTCDAASQCQ